MSLNEIVNCINRISGDYKISVKEVLEIVNDGSDKNIVSELIKNRENQLMSSVDVRIFLAELLDSKLLKLKDDVTYCIDDIKDVLKQGEIIGEGSFGQVSKGLIDLKGMPISVAIKKERVDRVNSIYIKKKDRYKSDQWNETFIANLLAEKVIHGGMGQAVPLFYKEFGCLNKCNFKGVENSNCIISVMEKADGALSDWENDNRYNAFRYKNMLFQIMAGLAALQSEKLQVFHNDIKLANILIHKVKKGGYWKYTIGKDVYYLPNLGFVAIIADYGVSYLLNKDIKYTRKSRSLGYRGIIRDEDSEYCGLVLSTRSNNNSIATDLGTISKFEVYPELKQYLSKKATSYNYDYNPRRSYFSYNGIKYYDKKIKTSDAESLDIKIIPTRFEKLVSKGDILSNKLLTSSIYPAIEHISDTQDVIRMFTGGKRATQSGDHFNLGNYIEGLEEYNTGKDTLSLKKSKCFARDFIKEFLTEYGIRPDSEEINSYKIV